MNLAPAWRLRDVFAAGVLFFATAAFTLWQNARVAVLWDISYLLDSSWRMSLGQMPYRDFPFAHAPLTFLLHAAIIKIFGRVYLPHIICAAVEASAATVLTWRILLGLLKPLGERAWMLGTVLAAPLVVVGIYGVYPHPIYDSDCILAVLVALFLMQRAGDGAARNAVAGAVCVVPLFFKQNIGLLFLLSVLAVVMVIALVRRLWRESVTPQLWFGGGAVAAFGCAVMTIEATAGLRNYFYWTITFAAQRRLPGFGLVMGTYHQSSLLWTVPAAVVGVMLLRADGLRDRTWARVGAFVLLAMPFVWTIVALALTGDADDRGDQLLSLWPHLLVLAGILVAANLLPSAWRRGDGFNAVLPIILLVTIHGTFLSQQLWGSTYAVWPLLVMLIAMMLTQVPAVARPMAWVIAATFLVCGGLYASSRERLSYVHLDGTEAHATLPELKGMNSPGPWVPDFEELVRFTNAEIPAGDGVLLLPGENPFYFATGRVPQFPVLMFDTTTDPYTPQQTLEEARVQNIRWLIVNRDLQLVATPTPDPQEILRALQQDFAPYRSVANYDIYRRK